METKVIAGQSLFDIAIQKSGAVESVFDLAVTNDLSITGPLFAGQELIDAPVRDQDIAGYYRVKGLTPATALNAGENGEGIEFWAIERDFIVSE